MWLQLPVRYGQVHAMFATSGFDGSFKRAESGNQGLHSSLDNKLVVRCITAQCSVNNGKRRCCRHTPDSERRWGGRGRRKGGGGAASHSIWQHQAVMRARSSAGCSTTQDRFWRHTAASTILDRNQACPKFTRKTMAQHGCLNYKTGKKGKAKLGILNPLQSEPTDVQKEAHCRRCGRR